MSIIEELDSLRARQAGIEAAAYMDLGSGTILGTSAGIRPPQERLDGLCAIATALLGGPADDTDEAVSVRSTEVLVFQRAPTTPVEAVCLVCAPEIDLDAVLSDVRKVLARVDE